MLVTCLWLTSFTSSASASDNLIADQLAANHHNTRVRHVIPFEYEGGFIVVDVRLDGILPVKFLFDTGSRLSVLTDNTLLPLLGRIPDERIRIVGSDRNHIIEGSLLRRTTIDVGNLSMRSQALVILDEDLLNLKDLTGKEVYGILGVEAFGAYALTIDYAAEQIVLEKKPRAQRTKRTSVTSVEIKDSRVYLPVFTKVHEGYYDTLNLLIDSGASLDLMLSAHRSDTTILPSQLIAGEIATGLGGKVFGFVGRSDSVNFGSYGLVQLVTHFQLLAETAPQHAVSTNRKGLIGNGLLERFTVTIDYPNEQLYLKPRRNMRTVRKYDRSGIQLVQDGAQLDRITVQRVAPGSPAEQAGIRAGDQLVQVGILPASMRGLEGVRRHFRGRIGKTVKLTLRRDGILHHKSLMLAKII